MTTQIILRANSDIPRTGRAMRPAGIWTPCRGAKKVRDGERDFELYGFLTTSPNHVVEPIHQKAMPVILTEPAEVDIWLSAPWVSG